MLSPSDARYKGLDILHGKNVDFDLCHVKGISRYHYVHDMHVANPTTLDVLYWVLLKDHRHVSLRITEDLFEELRTAAKLKKQFVIYVWNSINELPAARQYVKHTPEWPTQSEIDTMDKEISKYPGQESWVSRDQRHKAEKNVVHDNVPEPEQVEEQVPAGS